MKIAVAFCSMTWWASSELIISKSKHFVAKGMSLYVQLLKTKGHFVARENPPMSSLLKAILGKHGAQQPHSIRSIAPSLWIIFVTYRVRVTTSPLKFDGGSICLSWSFAGDLPCWGISATPCPSLAVSSKTTRICPGGAIKSLSCKMLWKVFGDYSIL